MSDLKAERKTVAGASAAGPEAGAWRLPACCIDDESCPDTTACIRLPAG
jgi:hypothetical protein